MTMSARMEGARELKVRLDKIAAAIEPAAVREVLVRRAQPIADRARAYAPRKSGHLAENIIVSPHASGGESGAYNPETVVYIGPTEDVDYAEPVEFGTPLGVTGPGQFYEHTAPHPYLRPAFDEEGPAAVTSAAEDIGAMIVRAGKG